MHSFIMLHREIYNPVTWESCKASGVCAAITAAAPVACGITAVGAVITRNRQLRNVNTDAVESYVGYGIVGSSIGLGQGRKCATEGKGKRNRP